MTEDSPLQAALDAMSGAAQMERSKYHLTLGELIRFLGDVDVDSPVEFDDGTSPCDPHSYRGYYEDLGLESTDETVSAMDLYTELCNDVRGETFTGYKGGDFLMEAGTPLWRASWGSLGDPIMDVEERDEKVVLTLGER